MTKEKDRTNNVIRFPVEAVSKFGFERVEKSRGTKTNEMELRGQLDLFVRRSKTPADVIPLPTGFSPFDEALTADLKGDPNAAELYVRAIDEGDSVADCYCNLGVMESKEGGATEAFDSFTKSLEHDPRHVESHYNLGNLYSDLGDLRLARVHYEMALELEPGFPSAYFNLGLVHALDEDFEAAVEALTYYKELAPEAEGRKADELLASLREVTNES